jgi:probable O-glycosylation ligase (exosortase A-associated)
MKGVIFTFLLTYGGALASLVRPYYGLLIYVCFAIIRPEVMWFHSLPMGPRYSLTIALALLAGWCLHGFGDWRFGRAGAIVALLLMFMLWSTIIAIPAFDQTLAWSYVEGHAKIVLPFIVGITTINSVRQLKQLAWVIVLTQGYLALELNISYYQGWNMMKEVGFAGLDNNGLAITMDTTIGLAFFLGLHSEGWWRKVLAFGFGVLMLHSVMFSFSRGGLLALIITAGLCFLLIRKEPKHYLFLIVAILIGFRLAGPQVVERFETAFSDEEHRDGSSNLRVRHWTACATHMMTQPWGAGPNQWQFVAPRYGLPAMEAHSHWMQTGAEMGFPGLLTLMGFYALTVVRLWPLARGKLQVSDPWLSYIARMVIASLIGFALSAQFVTCSGVEMPFYVVLLGAGALKLASASEPGTNAGRLYLGQPVLLARAAMAGAHPSVANPAG